MAYEDVFENVLDIQFFNNIDLYKKWYYFTYRKKINKKKKRKLK